MYTRRTKRRKYLPQPSNEPTVLGAAVATAVHSRTEDLLHLIVEYPVCEAKDLPGMAELMLRMLGEIHIQEEPTERQSQIIERASEELRKSQRQFRAAMTWLCSPKQLGSAAQTGLKLLASGKWEPGRYPHIDKESENFVGYFEIHGLRHFHIRLSLQDGRLVPFPRIAHLVDLFCACILDRCFGRAESEMPIKICPTCRMLFLSERKRFCSKDCQWRHYWTPDRRADDKWVKDLEKFSRTCKRQYGRSIEDLRKRLTLRTVKKRLESIRKRAKKENWAGWPTIVRRLQAVEQLTYK